MAKLGVRIQGHLKICEYQTPDDYQNRGRGSVLLNRRNAVHKDHVAILLALALTNRLNSSISYMFFGNGGATLTDVGTFTINPPNVTDNANLYNPTFFKLVDDRKGATPGNGMSARHISGTQFSDAEIRCVLWSNEPFGQTSRDDGVNLRTNPFVFNEIGLKSRDGKLLTHVTFSPVLKNASRILEIVYTIRLAVANPAIPPNPSSSNDVLREDDTYVLREDGDKVVREHEGP